MAIPALFGSELVTILIIAVVIIAAVLGLMVLNRRSKAAGKAVPGTAPAQQLGKADKTAAKAAAKAEKAAAKTQKPAREGREAAALAAKAQRDAAKTAAAQPGAYPAGPEGVPGTPDLAAVAEMPPVPGLEGAPAAPAAAPLRGPVAPPSVDDLFAASSAPAAAAAGVAAAAAAPPAGAGPIPAAAPAAPPAGGGFFKGKAGKQSAPSHADMSPGAALAADPLQAVMASILAGWGDLSTEDTNRLDVFRRDRVLAAIAAIEPPKETKGNEYARTRLTQLRRYAAYLEQGARQPGAPQVEHEFAGMSAPAGPTSGPAAPAPGQGPGPRGPVGPRATMAPGVAPAAAAAAAAGAMTAAAGRTPAPATPAPAPAPAAPPAGADADKPARSQTKSWYSVDSTEEAQRMPAPEPVMTPSKEPEIVILKTPPETEIPRSAQPQQRDWTSSPVLDDTAEVDVTADKGTRAEFDWGAGPEELAEQQTQLKAVDLSWNNHEAPAAPAPAPAPTPMETPSAPPEPPAAAPEAAPEAQPSWGSAGEASKTAEAAVAAAAAAFWETPDAPRMEQAASTWSKKISTAADIMALPPADRYDMLPFLEPGELAKVFKLSGDRDLKKAVIDTLEHIGNTASLDAIHESLEDTDPEVQLYALDAADRMLGKGI